MSWCRDASMCPATYWFFTLYDKHELSDLAKRDRSSIRGALRRLCRAPTRRAAFHTFAPHAARLPPRRRTGQRAARLFVDRTDRGCAGHRRRPPDYPFAAGPSVGPDANPGPDRCSSDRRRRSYNGGDKESRSRYHPDPPRCSELEYLETLSSHRDADRRHLLPIPPTK